MRINSPDFNDLISRGGHANFFRSAIAIPQREGSTSAMAIPQLFKEMLLRNRNSSIVFFLKSATSSPQLESFLPHFRHIFGRGVARIIYFLPPGRAFESF
jgi:hypothetical protein